MALSLAHDGDLQVEVRDIDRLFQEFPYQPVNNLILMTRDGWRTVYYGKPYIYSLLAAPFAGLFGADGLLFFNMLLTVAMIWMGASYLARFNPDGARRALRRRLRPAQRRFLLRLLDPARGPQHGGGRRLPVLGPATDEGNRADEPWAEATPAARSRRALRARRWSSRSTTSR